MCMMSKQWIISVTTIDMVLEDRVKPTIYLDMTNADFYNKGASSVILIIACFFFFFIVICGHLHTMS